MLDHTETTVVTCVRCTFANLLDGERGKEREGEGEGEREREREREREGLSRRVDVIRALSRGQNFHPSSPLPAEARFFSSLVYQRIAALLRRHGASRFCPANKLFDK